MTDLSPAAEAVFDALCMEELTGPQQHMAIAHAAAALRAAACYCSYDRIRLLAIAGELDHQSN